MTKHQSTFAENVFDKDKMKKYLSKATYAAVVSAAENFGTVGKPFEKQYARALCKWALKKGATSFAHVFYPLNNRTAFKKESLFDFDGRRIVPLDKEQLLVGEGDASSFPSGGMRQTFQAKGVTEWDCTCYPYVKDNCLFIPCTFCGANGEALDSKKPLLNSCKALNSQALRLLAALGERFDNVCGMVGAEQEYFLADKALFLQREDLVLTGRTLFGAAPPKKQQFRDRYFAPQKEKIAQFMREVDERLWKLGVVVKTEHNEVAPNQYELAPRYARVTVADEHNRLITETLQQAADEIGLACILHEKPFDGFNGSGKHNNWSLFADGTNLLETGKTAKQHARFLLILAAIVKAADDFGELLLASIASHGNDCRLGGLEAPPRTLTVSLGAQLNRAIADVCSGKIQYGVDFLPNFLQNADRNRTSPFAFAGNKFEFRSVGSSASVADVNTALNVAVAEELRIFADKLENASDVAACAKQLVCETFLHHKKVLFDGDNYSAEWAQEAKLRNLKCCGCADAAVALTNAHNVNVLARHNVLSMREVAARQKILLSNYVDTVCLEASVALKMCREKVFPSAEQYLCRLARLAQHKSALNIQTEMEVSLLERMNKLLLFAEKRTICLQKLLAKLQTIEELHEKAYFCRDRICVCLQALRLPVDRMEILCPQHLWQLPTYTQLLFAE